MIYYMATSIEEVLNALRTDTKAAIYWFINNYIQTNPSKFQIMFPKHFKFKDVPDLIEIGRITITCQSDFKHLEMTLDNKLLT